MCAPLSLPSSLCVMFTHFLSYAPCQPFSGHHVATFCPCCHGKLRHHGAQGKPCLLPRCVRSFDILQQSIMKTRLFVCRRKCHSHKCNKTSTNLLLATQTTGCYRAVARALVPSWKCEHAGTSGTGANDDPACHACVAFLHQVEQKAYIHMRLQPKPGEEQHPYTGLSSAVQVTAQQADQWQPRRVSIEK